MPVAQECRKRAADFSMAVGGRVVAMAAWPLMLQG